MIILYKYSLFTNWNDIIYVWIKLQLVHNYGHGVDGIALSWGTACHATELVQESLDKSVRTAKL